MIRDPREIARIVSGHVPLAGVNARELVYNETLALVRPLVQALKDAEERADVREGGQEDAGDTLDPDLCLTSHECMTLLQRAAGRLSGAIYRRGSE